MSLLTLWKQDEKQITDKTVQQLISFAGEGKLADGNRTSVEFRELCQNIIDKAPRPDKRTISINQASLTSELHQFIDRAMFSYPNPSSTFISETHSSKITFSPHLFYQFNLWQQFADNTRFWVWDMDYPDHLLVKHPSQEWCVVENRQQRKFTDLDHLTEILNKPPKMAKYILYQL